MKRLSRVLFITLGALTLAACGASLPGGLSMPGGGAGEAASAGAAAAGDGAEAAADAARPVKPALAAYYQKLEHKALYPLLHNSPSDALYEKAKADVGRDLLWESGNPDPAWIKQWKTQDWSYASGNSEALLQAAFNRSWEAACKAEFETTYGSHRKLAARFADELAAVEGEANHYARMAGYIALAGKLEKAAAAAGLDPAKDPFGPSGFRVTLLRHAVAYHRGSPAAYTEFPWSRFGAHAERARKEGRELGADAAFERQAYCTAAARDGGLGVTPFAEKGSGAADPTVWGDREAVATKVKQLVASASKSLAVESGIRIGTIEAVGGITFHDREPRLARLDEATVDAVERSGAGATVTVTRKRVESYTYACKETTTVEGVGDDGRVRYKMNCKSGDKIYKLTGRVTFAELPPGLTLAKGDLISFSADVVKDESKKVTDTAARVEWVRALELKGRLLIDLKRGSKLQTF